MAEVEFSKPPVKRQGDLVIDEFKVKNMSSQPIARLTIESIYYEKGGAVIAGGKGFVNGLLQPGEVQTVRVETPFNPKMNSSNYKFTHANGSVTPKRVDKIDNPDAPAKRAKAAPKAAARSVCRGRLALGPVADCRTAIGPQRTRRPSTGRVQARVQFDIEWRDDR